jgi:hypothetical protein
MEIISMIMAALLSGWAVANAQQILSGREKIPFKVTVFTTIALVIVLFPVRWWPFFFFLVGLIAVNGAKLASFAQAARQRRNEEWCAPVLLADIQIQLRAGSSPFQALQASTRASGPTGALAKSILDQIENAMDDSAATELVKTMTAEYRQVLRAPHLAQGQIEFLRDRYARLAHFRRKSRQAQFQPAFQSAVLIALFCVTVIWSLHAGRIDWSTAFVAASMMIGGFWWMQRLTRLPRLKV